MVSQMSTRVKILGFSKTFLDDQVKDSEIMIPGHKVFRRDHGPGKKGGGVVVYVCDNIPVIERCDFEHPDIEAIWLEVKQTGCKPVPVCHLYRPPDATSGWLDSLEGVLDKVQATNKEIILFGDLNVDLLKESSIKESLTTITESLQLVQLIEGPTRIKSQELKQLALH